MELYQIFRDEWERSDKPFLFRQTGSPPNKFIAEPSKVTAEPSKPTVAKEVTDDHLLVEDKDHFPADDIFEQFLPEDIFEQFMVRLIDT